MFREHSVFVVTGANSGLGLETVRGLVRLKDVGTVVLACRNYESAHLAIEEIAGTDSKLGDKMIGMTLDLSRLESIRNFVMDFKAKFNRLDCLICNAGVYYSMDEFRKTKDGFEIHVGVNHLGHFLLTNLLLDMLRASAPSRVVIVSSMLLKEGELNLENLNYSTGIRPSTSRTPVGYADSKLMNALFALQLSKLESERGIRVFCVSPGWCKSRLGRNIHIPWYMYPAMCLLSCFVMKKPEKGCETILYCAHKSDIPSGLFFRDKSNAPDMEQFLEERSALASQLWAESARLVNL